MDDVVLVQTRCSMHRIANTTCACVICEHPVSTRKHVSTRGMASANEITFAIVHGPMKMSCWLLVRHAVNTSPANDTFRSEPSADMQRTQRTVSKGLSNDLMIYLDCLCKQWRRHKHRPRTIAPNASGHLAGIAIWSCGTVMHYCACRAPWWSEI